MSAGVTPTDASRAGISRSVTDAIAVSERYADEPLSVGQMPVRRGLLPSSRVHARPYVGTPIWSFAGSMTETLYWTIERTHGIGAIGPMPLTW